MGIKSWGRSGAVKLLFVLVVQMVFSFNIKAQDTIYSKAFADAIIDRYFTINNLTGKGWEYSNSIVLIGIEQLYYETGNEKYLNYIQSYVNSYIDNEGNISFNPDDNNLDHLHPGWLCLTLWEETGLERYKLAAQTIRAEFDNQPRNPSGGFWHKQRYENQMWADGIYMAEPFLIRYGAIFNDLEYAANEATKQTILLADHAYDSTKNLLRHGWDETKMASWADTVTGKSPEVWSRGMGWYCMAIVDILDYLPTDHANYNRMIEILNGLAIGLKDYQDPESGLWYQVVDKGDSTNNWLETSGSSMYVYALKKAVDKGYIDSDTYLPVAEKGWEGLKKYITFDSKDQPVINQFVQGMGIKDTYEIYISQSVVSTPDSRYPHGYCGILMASSVMEFPLPNYYELETDKEGSGNGKITINPNLDDYAEGSSVELTATPYSGNEFVGWEGDTTSTVNPITIQMDSAINVTAVFSKIQEPSAVKNVNAKNILTVYPTKASTTLQLASGLEGNKTIHIFDLAGKTIISKQWISGQETLDIDVSELKQGLYTLRLITATESYSQQFIKQ